MEGELCGDTISGMMKHFGNMLYACLILIMSHITLSQYDGSQKGVKKSTSWATKKMDTRSKEREKT